MSGAIFSASGTAWRNTFVLPLLSTVRTWRRMALVERKESMPRQCRLLMEAMASLEARNVPSNFPEPMPEAQPAPEVRLHEHPDRIGAADEPGT